MNIYKSDVKLPRRDEYILWRHEHRSLDSFGKIDKATTEDKENNGAPEIRTCLQISAYKLHPLHNEIRRERAQGLKGKIIDGFDRRHYTTGVFP